MNTYDGFLLLSFGGPEGPDDVMPFLRNVLRGRHVPESRMLEVAEHYQSYGGVSPINAQNRRLLEAIHAELSAHGIDLPVYWGNRNWTPYLHETLTQMREDGVTRALCFVTSAYSSYSGCRQYREDIEHATSRVANAPQIEKIRAFFNHPGFIAANQDHLRAAISAVAPGDPKQAAIAFTAHSIPTSMSASCDYLVQLEETARMVAEAAPSLTWQLVYQSRSGPPGQAWLEPDISDHLHSLKQRGFSDVVVAPIGFISDHMEIIHDLDSQARATARELSLGFQRAATAGAHPSFIAAIRDLIEERIFDRAPRSIGRLPARAAECASECCPAPLRAAPRPNTGG